LVMTRRASAVRASSWSASWSWDASQRCGDD
jgi:hypothetical protein